MVPKKLEVHAAESELALATNKMSHDHNVNADTSQHDHGMATSFEFSSHATIVFSFMKAHDAFELLLLLCVLFLCGVMRESLATYRRKTLRTGDRTNSMGFKQKGVALFVTVYVVDMLLMLAMMTFNIGVFLAIVSGVGFGHYWYWDVNQVDYQRVSQQEDFEDKVSSCC